MIVCKFGGSSLADASQMKKVRAILESNPERAAVVVSAPGKRNKDDEKITDLLYRCNSLVQKGQSCRPVFNEIVKRFSSIAAELRLDVKELSEMLDDIRVSIDAGHGADYAASRGEFLSAYIMSRYLGWELIDAADVIVINSDSTVNDATYQKLAARIEKGKHYVIPGFYGETEQGVLKTFSRGGSDITGAIIAKAFNADTYENWTDVSGIYRADPRVVSNAEVIPSMSYKEVRELSDVGASVFHEEAIAPVYHTGIPINVRNTNRPEDPGTRILPSSECRGISGISARKGLSCISLRKLMLFKKSGMRHSLLTMLHIFGIRPCFSLFGIDSIVWFFETKQASESVCQAMCDRLMKDFILDSITVDHGYAIVGIAGNGMDESVTAAEAVIAMKDAGIPAYSINSGASDTTILIGVKENQADEAVKAIYSRFFG